MEFAPLLVARDAEFEGISELVFDPTADLGGKARYDRVMRVADLGAKPNPNLEFD